MPVKCTSTNSNNVILQYIHRLLSAFTGMRDFMTLNNLAGWVQFYGLAVFQSQHCSIISSSSLCYLR